MLLISLLLTWSVWFGAPVHIHGHHHCPAGTVTVKLGPPGAFACQFGGIAQPAR